MKKRNKMAGILVCLGMAVLAGCQKKTATTKQIEITQDMDEQMKIQRYKDMEQVTSPDFKLEGISGFQVEQDGVVLYQLAYTKREDRASFLYWDMPVPYQSYVVVDTEAMYELLACFASVDWKNLQAVKTSDTGLSKSGTKITLCYVEGEVSRQTKWEEKKFTILVGKNNGEGQCYCSLEGKEEQVFLLNCALIDRARKQNPYDLILKIPYLLDIDTVKKIEIKGLNKKITMEHGKNGNRVNKKQVREEVYNALYSSLLQPGIVGEYKKKAAEERELFSITYTRTKKEYKDYQVQFYSYDEQQDSVKVNGMTYFLVSKAEVEQLVQDLQKTEW